MTIDNPAIDGAARHGVVTLVGNPRPASRTRAAGETAAVRVAHHLGVRDDRTTVDLADLAPEVLAPVHPRADVALRTVASARLLVVATPVYKASYTGLLKAFLDLYGPRALDGVLAVPLVVSASPTHADAGDIHLRPLLQELGATVPSRAIAILESELPATAALVDAWWSETAVHA
jgi:FMN reductase